MCVCAIRQLEAAQQQLAEALGAAAGPDTEDEQQHQPGDFLSSDGDHSRPSSSLGQHAQQEQTQAHAPAHADGQHHSKSVGLAGSFTAALSNAASGFNLAVLKGDEQQHEQSPPRQQQSSPSLSPFALARKFVADREVDAVSRLKVCVCCMLCIVSTRCAACWGQVHTHAPQQ